jgi:nickel/cobalt exporter
MRRLLLLLNGGVALVVLPVATAAPAAAHPLGNFTVNHYNGLHLEPWRVVDTAVVDWAEIPTVQLAPRVDADGDGRMTRGERNRHAARQCAALADAVQLRVDGTRVTFAVESSGFEYRPGTAGLRTARLTCRLAADVDLAEGGRVFFRDTFEAGRVGWREVTATAKGVHIDRSPVPAESITDELRRYPDDLLSSPLDVREATLAVLPGAGASTRSPKGITVPTSGLAERVIGGVTARFNELVGRESLTVGVGLLAIALSLALGAAHALLPGHGKTVMAAYLAGRQGSAKDAVVVGATVTVTHTAGVLVLGLALTLSASLAGDAVLGWLGVASGILVAVVGTGLLAGALRRGHAAGSDHSSPHSHGGRVHTHGPADRRRARDAARHPAEGHHHHDHGSHHHHARRVTRRGLVGMGVAGGLVPSPSALVVLLAAVALGRTAFGVLLVLSYGLGMAATLTAAGLLLVRVRERLQRTSQRRRHRPVVWLTIRWATAVPFTTACLVIVVGLGLAARSYASV